MTDLTVATLQAITGTSASDPYVAPLNTVFSRYNINTSLRQAAFLSQVIVESASFHHIVENLNYSEAGLLTTFPKYFDANTAITYAHNPEKIANRVYANRYGNGDESSGDGWLFRGRGLIQITFKNNYVAIAHDLAYDPLQLPAYMETPAGATESAAWFWNSKELNDLADKSLFVDITRKINGGLNGLSTREAAYSKALKVLNG